VVSSHIFQFTGNLLLAREASLATWKKAFREKHGDLNLTTCHIADIAAEQLAGELSTPPFLAEKRLTIVHIDWKISVKKQKNEEEGQEEEFKKNPKKIELYDQFDFWEKVIAHIPEDHIVAFVGPENIPPLQEILNRVAQTKKFEVLETPWEIQNYIQNRLPLLSTQGAKLFALRIGVNYKPKNDEPQKINFLLLENEIQKLLLLPEITEKQILENITESIEVQNFKIIDTLLF